jgi:hypothetical protein
VDKNAVKNSIRGKEEKTLILHDRFQEQTKPRTTPADDDGKHFSISLEIKQTFEMFFSAECGTFLEVSCLEQENQKLGNER